MKFVTDTSTLCVFDPAAIRHRIGDRPDWWSIESEELREVNNGNVAFVGLGDDGEYEVLVEERLSRATESIVLKCLSGSVFVGAGEEVTAGGLEPEAIRGGAFISLKPGVYRLDVLRMSNVQLTISFNPIDGEATNNFLRPIRV